MDVNTFFSNTHILIYSLIAGAMATTWYLHSISQRPKVDPRFAALHQQLGGSLRKGQDGNPTLTALQLGRMWSITFVDDDPAKPYLEIRCPVSLAWELHIHHYAPDEPEPQGSERSGLKRLVLTDQPYGDRVTAWTSDEQVTRPLLVHAPIQEHLRAICERPLTELWLGKRELVFWWPLQEWTGGVKPQEAKLLLQHLTAIIEMSHEGA
ncbi:MAG: hypothetical protein HY597_06000 [Candidatus Omnitrophica bacterium]|nr:hypothetical protein [Candidatus Omnitrophota bacterium]